MYFDKYEDFLNENESRLKKRQEKKLKKAEKQKQKSIKAKEKGKVGKSQKLAQKSAQSKEDADALGKYSDNLNKKGQGSSTATTENPENTEKQPQEDKTPKSTNVKGGEEGTDTEKEKTKETDIKKMSKIELNEVLKDWNNEYSLEFKFKNDMPKTPAKNLVDLKNSISPQRVEKVMTGTKKLAQILSNKHFDGQDIEISGYTSTTASESYNSSLSDRRAESLVNAVSSLMKENGSETDINFTAVGHGEDPKYLIVLNDTTTKEEPKINTSMYSGNIEELKAEINDSKEARQEMNRRVIVVLKGFDVKIETTETPETPEETTTTEIVVEKPESPNPNNVKFNFDSYILTKNSEKLLATLAVDIKKWNESKEDDDKIKNIYISAHTLKADESNPKQEEMQKEKLFILSNNRVYTVKRYLQQEIGEELVKNIVFYSYPVSYRMGKEKKVEIHFDNSKHMQEAEALFAELADEYNVKNGDRGYAGKNYVKNQVLRDGIIRNLKKLAQANVGKKKIPLELWYSTGRFGLGNEENLDRYREDLKNALKKSELSDNPEDYVYNPK